MWIRKIILSLQENIQNHRPGPMIRNSVNNILTCSDNIIIRTHCEPDTHFVTSHGPFTDHFYMSPSRPSVSFNCRQLSKILFDLNFSSGPPHLVMTATRRRHRDSVQSTRRLTGQHSQGGRIERAQLLLRPRRPRAHLKSLNLSWDQGT